MDLEFNKREDINKLKLSDTKKRTLTLKQLGFNQAEIGLRILNTKQQPMTRQAISKALATIRKEFLL